MPKGHTDGMEKLGSRGSALTGAEGSGWRIRLRNSRHRATELGISAPGIAGLGKTIWGAYLWGAAGDCRILYSRPWCQTRRIRASEVHRPLSTEELDQRRPPESRNQHVFPRFANQHMKNAGHGRRLALMHGQKWYPLCRRSSRHPVARLLN